MPRTSMKSVEEEIDLSKKKSKQSFAVKWFNDYAVNNRDQLKIVCDLTSRSAQQQFSMFIRSGNNEIYAVVFYVTFEEILKFLRSKEKSYKEFTIEIANSINIGYCNSVDESNEKVGNFMPVLEYINVNQVIDSDDDRSECSEKLIRWKELNIKRNVEYCKEIQNNVFNSLVNNYKTRLVSAEAVIPLFCIFMDNITNVLKQMYAEIKGTDKSEVTMNVLGLFDAFYSFNEEDGSEVIEFCPNVTMKMALKDDVQAASE